VIQSIMQTEILRDNWKYMVIQPTANYYATWACCWTKPGIVRCCWPKPPLPKPWPLDWLFMRSDKVLDDPVAREGVVDNFCLAPSKLFKLM
jgi:hypothetical protein